MVETVTTRADIEARIAELRTKQERMPSHWAERREQVAEEIEALVLDWLASDG
jgi:hypothetical protein